MPTDDQLASRDFLSRIRARTPARVLVERAGAAYRTSTQLELRSAHAAARDAVRTELDLERDFGRDFVREWKLFDVRTRAGSKDEYLLRPDLGRELSEDAAAQIKTRCPAGADLQIVIGDGLSVTAVATQVPRLLPLIGEAGRKFTQMNFDRDKARSPDDPVASSPVLVIGQPFVVRHCRVGVMNDVGDLLAPQVVVLLIGERPGLATAESLSAYMAYRPRAGHTDAQRNLISNIHARGVSLEQAAGRIVRLAEKIMTMQCSGVDVKEDLPEKALSNQQSALSP
ncbi:MAG TPA: ethanolamine ammonia-lyase subunit EutC [Candidatus Angelobacter sp.]